MNSDHDSEVISVGSRRTVSTHGRPAWPIRIGNDTICATNKACVYSVCCFLPNWRLTCLWRQSAASASTPLSPSVARHRIYYNTDPCLCLEPRRLCSLLIGSPRSVTDKLQRVLNAAARVITNTKNKKYESGLSRILHHDLHRLDVTERIQFRVAATVYQCRHGMASAYLTELCTRWVRVIYSMRSLIVSQRRDLRMGVIWENLGAVLNLLNLLKAIY